MFPADSTAPAPFICASLSWRLLHQGQSSRTWLPGGSFASLARCYEVYGFPGLLCPPSRGASLAGPPLCIANTVSALQSGRTVRLSPCTITIRRTQLFIMVFWLWFIGANRPSWNNTTALYVSVDSPSLLHREHQPFSPCLLTHPMRSAKLPLATCTGRTSASEEYAQTTHDCTTAE